MRAAGAVTRRAAALALLFCVAARAERTSVRGKVTDQHGRPLHRASVRLKCIQTLQVRSYFSGRDGAFRFHGLNSDLDYEVRAEFGSSESRTFVLDRFESRAEVVLELKIELPGR